METSRKKSKTASKFTGRFSSTETVALSRIFAKITDTGRMDRSQFRDVLHSTFDMNDDNLMDRMFRTFDSDADGYLTCKEWLYGLWIFLRGNMVEKATYSFQVYDIDGDGYLCKTDIFQLLKTSLRQSATKMISPKKTATERTSTPSPRPPQRDDSDRKTEPDGGFQYLQEEMNTVAVAGGNAEDDPDEGARDLTEIAIALLDKDMDGRVSMADFLTSVSEDNLLLEILGPCLPSAARAAAILSALSSSLSLTTGQSSG